MSLPDFKTDLNGKELQFSGNSTIKGCEQPLGYTQEHLEEIARCAADVRYFAERYYYILSLDEGMVKIKLRDYQLEIIDMFQENRYSIVMATRQCGKSTSFELFVLHYVLFSPDKKNVALLANKAANSYDLLRKIKSAYELLPKWLQQGVKAWNQSYIELENGCRVMAAATSSSSIRGLSINLLIVDEAGFIPTNVWDMFYSSSYPTISSSKTSKVIFVSTPNGLNHFYKFWTDSLAGRNRFANYKVDWWDVPGRDEKWKEETIANVGKETFDVEYGLNFMGSGGTLIEGRILSLLRYEEPLNEVTPLHDELPNEFWSKLRVYEKPIRGNTYFVGVDPSKISADSTGDAFAIQVIDTTELPWKQVCVFYAKNDFSYLQGPEVISKISAYYNDAVVFVENNSMGQEVANITAFDFECEGVYFEPGKTLPGVNTNAKTKRLGCSNLKILLENFKLLVVDFDTISQLSTFVKKRDTYAADADKKDDLVMSLIASIFFMQRTEFQTEDDRREFIKKLLDGEATRRLAAADCDGDEAPAAVGFSGAELDGHDGIEMGSYGTEW